MVKIFVGNLNPKSKVNDLRKLFESYGKVTECDIVNNYAFVHMENSSDAETAIAKLHNVELDGAKMNVEMSHGSRSNNKGGGPMRRRMNDRRPIRDSRDARNNGPPRPYPVGPRGPFGQGAPDYYPPMRDDRYGQPAWDEGYPGSFPPQRGPPRSYNMPTNESPMRYSERESIRPSPRVPPREAPFREPTYAEPVPPPREFQRKSSPPRGRYDGYENFGDYERYREPVPSRQPSAPSAPRAGDYYDNYGSYSGGSYDLPPREIERNGNFDSSYDYGYYESRETRAQAPPRPMPNPNFGRP